MKLNTPSSHYLYFLLYAALLTLPALAVDIRAFSTFEPIKVLATVGIGTLIGWWGLFSIEKIEHKKTVVKQNWETRLASICFYGYWISLLVATIFSVAPWVSLFGFAPRYQGLIMYASIFLASMGVSRLNRRDIEKLLGIAIIGGAIVSIFGILQGFIPALTQWWNVDNFLGRIFSTMGHPSYLADYLLLVTPLFYWKWVSSRRWLDWSMLGVVVCIALLLTSSRGALLGLAGSLLLFVGVYGYWHKRRGLLLSAIITPLLIVTVIVGVNLLPSNSIARVPLLNRLVLNEENLRSISTRFVLWPSTVKEISQRPLFGYGPDTFALSYAKMAPKELLQSENFNAYADRAHNFFLDSLVNVGVVGTAFLLLLLWLTIRVVIRSGDHLLLALGSALFGHIISQQFEFSLTVHLIFFWIYMGVIWRFGERGWISIHERLSSLPLVKATLSKLVTILMIGIFFFYIFPTFLADRLAREGDFAKAIFIAPHRNEYVLEEARNLISQNGDQRHILNLLRSARNFSGDLDYRPYYYEGTMWSTSSDYPKSFSSFEEAIKRSPIFPPLYKAYGIILLQSGDSKGALAQFTQYLNLAPPYWKMKDLDKKGELTGWNKQQYQVFYKLNPEFDEIFELIQKASIAK
ncbi:MAG: O-antigen ligase family protein [Candidatus Peregrinibacteria bacterium]|nr:O-antigen ligase family protein [Candidatus Peregrinibacteria bacterium]